MEIEKVRLPDFSNIGRNITTNNPSLQGNKISSYNNYSQDNNINMETLNMEDTIDTMHYDSWDTNHQYGYTFNGTINESIKEYDVNTKSSNTNLKNLDINKQIEDYNNSIKAIDDKISNTKEQLDKLIESISLDKELSELKSKLAYYAEIATYEDSNNILANSFNSDEQIQENIQKIISTFNYKLEENKLYYLGDDAIEFKIVDGKIIFHKVDYQKTQDYFNEIEDMYNKDKYNSTELSKILGEEYTNLSEQLAGQEYAKTLISDPNYITEEYLSNENFKDYFNNNWDGISIYEIYQAQLEQKTALGLDEKFMDLGDYLTESEIAVYLYLYDKEGEKGASKYIDLFKDRKKEMQAIRNVSDEIETIIDWPDYINNYSDSLYEVSNYISENYDEVTMDWNEFLKSENMQELLQELSYNKYMYENPDKDIDIDIDEWINTTAGKTYLNEFIVNIEKSNNNTELISSLLSSEEEMTQDYINKILSGEVDPKLKENIETYMQAWLGGLSDGMLSQFNFISNIVSNEQSAEDLRKSMYSQILSASYSLNIANQVGNSEGAMLPSMYLGVLGQSAILEEGLAGLSALALNYSGSLWYMGTMATTTYHEEIINGTPMGRAVLDSLISSALEVGAERIIGVIPGLSDPQGVSSTFREALSTWGKSALGEGLEELIQPYIMAGINYTLYGEESDIDATNEEAFMSFIVGTIVGATFGAGNLSYDSSANVKLVDGATYEFKNADLSNYLIENPSATYEDITTFIKEKGNIQNKNTDVDEIEHTTSSKENDINIDANVDAENLYEKYDLNDEIIKFIESRGYDILTMYNNNQLDRPNQPIYLGKRTMRVSEEISLSEISGISGENILNALQSRFLGNTSYSSRSDGLMNLSSDELIEQIRNSSDEGIVVCKDDNGNYVVTENGTHRMSLLLLEYYNEINNAETMEEIDKINQKYTIPVNIDIEDTIIGPLEDIAKKNGYRKVSRNDDNKLIIVGQTITKYDKFGNPYFERKTVEINNNQALEILNGTMTIDDCIAQNLEIERQEQINKVKEERIEYIKILNKMYEGMSQSDKNDFNYNPEEYRLWVEENNENIKNWNNELTKREQYILFLQEAKKSLNINDIAEVKEVSKLDMSISKFDKYSVNTNQSYQNYDYVIKPKTDLETIIREISESNNKFNILIELDNINELNLELLENIPDNVSIRISNYTNEDYKVFKSAPNASANATLQHLTYSVAELKEIINKIDIIESNINPQWNDYQKAQYVYEYLKGNIRYKSNPGGSLLREKQFDGLMSLVAGESTCQGFAHTYSIILNRLGIDTTEVWGSLDGEGQHAYNIVTIDGNSFIVDTVREALEKKSPGKYTSTGFGVENTNQYVAKNHIDLYNAVNSNIETIKSYLGNYNLENQTRFQNFEEISLENLKNITSDTLEINGEIYSTKDIEQYLIEKQNIQIQKQNIEIQQKRLNEYKENLKQKYNISETEAQKIMNILISGRYNPRFIQNTIKTNDYNEAIDIYDEFEKLGLSEISNYKDIISKINTLEKRTPSPIEIKNIMEQLKINNDLDSNLAYLRTVSPELKQKLLQDINFKEYFLEEILSTKNPWYNFRDSYNSINNVLEISEIFTLLSNNELLKDLSQEKQGKLSTLYASMFSKDSETTWRNALENDTVFKSIINNASDYYSIIQINDYKLLLSVINKINENQINFDYYGSLSNIENIYKLLNEPLADDVIVKIVNSSHLEVVKEFFKNNPKAIDLYSKFNINTLLSYSENGVVFNEKILKRADFFEMLKSDNLIEFRSNIDKLYKNNASIDIEERITKYYQELLNNYDFKTEMFRQYSNEEVVWNSNGKDYIIDYTARELCMNEDIEGLKQLTSQKISEIIVDALFKDNIYNVRINITEMLRYNNQLSEDNKILDKNTVQLYEAILNIDGLSSQDKINLYNILKEKNMNLKFYEDIRKLKDASYDNIKQDMVKLSEHNELISQELSLQTGTTVYDFRNQEYIALVRELRSNYNEITNNERECFSLISNNNTSTIGDGIIYGYNNFDNDYIIHMSETDSYSSDSRDSNFATNYPNRIATSSQLAESYFGISEINIATKKLNNGKYSSLKPDFILSKNEITTEEIDESQRLGIPIMLISENTTTSKANELGTSAMTDKTKEYSYGYDMYLQQKIENRLKNIKQYNEENINNIFNSAKNIAQER